MNDFLAEQDREWAAMAKQLSDSRLPSVQRLASAFDWITRHMIRHAAMEVEAARALGDEEQAVKQQIKMETIKHARGIFKECHVLATGRKAWDDPESL
jgi:hypothetical protein